jgi:hypothetical protein
MLQNWVQSGVSLLLAGETHPTCHPGHSRLPRWSKPSTVTESPHRAPRTRFPIEGNAIMSKLLRIHLALLLMPLGACSVDQLATPDTTLDARFSTSSTTTSGFVDGEYVEHQGTIYLVSGNMLWTG